MNKATIVSAQQLDTTTVMDASVLERCHHALNVHGWVLLRGFEANLDLFSELVTHFCSQLTFDPAREYSGHHTQKVDAGTGAIGLHIENGNTPFPPDIVGFYSHKSARHGSQTTVCDGHEVYQRFNQALKQTFNQPITVSRTLAPQHWKHYALNEHPGLHNIDEVNATHLEEILAIVPNHRGRLNDDGSLYYELDISAIAHSQLANTTAFANAILGPSVNYEPPVYRFANGDIIDAALKNTLIDITEPLTVEINWHDGDMALIDNKRVMHGRRAITDQQNRELYIGMGTL